MAGLGHASFEDQVSRGTVCSLGQPNKAIAPPASGRVSDRTMVGHDHPCGLRSLSRRTTQ